ncbi:hypothetical protein ABIB08_007971 [Bradyrhizobium sp. RT11b]
MQTLWELAMSLRASQSSRDGNAGRRWPRRSHNSRRQARFSIRRPIACRRCRSKSLTVDANPALLFIYPSRGCVPSQQSILPPLRNVIGDWRLGTIFGKIIERCWCFGDAKCCCATVSGRLSFRARRIARRIQLHQGTALPTARGCEWWAILKCPTGAEGKRLQILRGGDIRFSCLTANALAVNRSPVVLPTDESWCDA